jgi:starch phosphorylase
MDPDTFTIGFARRASTYKRGALLFDHIERLKAAAAQVGPIQIVYAGKAHPHDVPGKEVIKQIFRAKAALEGTIQVAYLEDYDMDDGRIITSGVDLWLNTPEPPLEASGTSGMKAALNGIPSLSVLDGWWIEGHIEGLTGWAIGDGGRACDGSDRSRDAQCLYDKLESTILPLYYRERERFIDVMRFAMALNGSFFNTQRMMREYVQKAYF